MKLLMLIQFSGCGDEEGKKFILAIALHTKYCDDCTECVSEALEEDRPLLFLMGDRLK